MNHILLNKIIHYLCLSIILLIPTGFTGLHYTGYFVGIVLAIAIFKSEGIKRTYIIGAFISVISVIVSIPILTREQSYYSFQEGQITNKNGEHIKENIGQNYDNKDNIILRRNNNIAVHYWELISNIDYLNEHRSINGQTYIQAIITKKTEIVRFSIGHKLYNDEKTKNELLGESRYILHQNKQLIGE